jgi:hypothetical protein
MSLIEPTADGVSAIGKCCSGGGGYWSSNKCEGRVVLLVEEATAETRRLLSLSP